MRNKKIKSPRPQPTAFTLVEMLVSVTLVLLMMTLFASMFQLATGSMTKQRGIAQLDQAARVLDTIVRRDFQKRTFRYAHPFYPGEDSATSPTSFSNRTGYLYFSTNEPGGIDDLVQFTVDANILNESADATPFFGRATELLDRLTAGNNGLRVSPNQPEADDGSLSPNSVASGPTAEVCYFIRNGNLYRRINLIREPLQVAGQNLGPQPTSRGGFNYFSGYSDPSNAATFNGLYSTTSDGLTNDFYRHFDQCAFRSMPDANGNRATTVLGVGSLANESSGAAADVIANPARRFGFNPFTGFSREHTQAGGAGVASQFLGRFLHAETSAMNFNWPQDTSRDEIAGQTIGTPDANQVLRVDLNFDGTFDVTTSGNPFDLAGCPLVLNPLNGVVSSFDNSTTVGAEGRGGIRRAEDLLLANVHEMKVELWDNRLQRFVVPGHASSNPATGQAGDYHVLRNLNNGYGPKPGSNVGAVFDTWHPKYLVSGSIGTGLAPFVAYQYYPPRENENPPGPSPAAMPDVVTGYWTQGSSFNADGVPRSYGIGEIVFAPVIFDADSPQVFEWPDRPPLSGATSDRLLPQAFQLAYRVIAVNDLNGMNGIETGLVAPNFPTAPGRRFTDGEIIWESFDNRVPLKSIRLSFRFLDKQTDNMRNLSLIIPMTEAAR